MITLEDYFMGRDTTHAEELASTMRTAAAETVERVNRLIMALEADGIPLDVSQKTKSLVVSGWRPQSINSTTPGAAIRSKHIYCLACDLYDPGGFIDDWCISNQRKLEEIGLWLEHPSATKNWSHVQIVPPNSKTRVFYP